MNATATQSKQASKAALTKIFNAAGLSRYTGKADGKIGFMIHEERTYFNATIISWEVGHRNEGWKWEQEEMLCELVCQLAIAGGYHVTTDAGSVKVWKGEAA